MVANCYHCGMEKEVRESLNLRIPASLKRQISDYADDSGVTINAAATLLLAAALKAERRRR